MNLIFLKNKSIYRFLLKLRQGRGVPAVPLVIVGIAP